MEWHFDKVGITRQLNAALSCGMIVYILAYCIFQYTYLMTFMEFHVAAYTTISSFPCTESIIVHQKCLIKLFIRQLFGGLFSYKPFIHVAGLLLNGSWMAMCHESPCNLPPGIRWTVTGSMIGPWWQELLGSFRYG